MIIPPVVGAPPSATGSEVTGDGFAEAIAAALSIQVQPAVSLRETAETSVDVAVPAPAPYAEMPDQIARLVTAAIASDTASVQVAEDPAPGAIAPAAHDATTGDHQVRVDVPLVEAGGEGFTSTEPEGEDGGPEVTATAPETDPSLPPHADAVPLANADQPVQTGAAAAVVTPLRTARPASAPRDQAGPPAVDHVVSTPVTADLDRRPRTEPTAVAGATEIAQHPEVAEIAQHLEVAEEAWTAPATSPVATPDGDRDAKTKGTIDVRPSVDATSDGVATIERPNVGQTTRVEQTQLVPHNTLRRVENAIRHLENAPPPKTITIALDDQGLHRVTVSLLADGVRLTVPEGATTDGRLIADLEQSLASRGFDLSGRERHRERDRRDEADTFIPSSYAQSRSATGSKTGDGTESDLRI